MTSYGPPPQVETCTYVAEELQNFILLWFTSVIIITVVKELYAGAS